MDWRHCARLTGLGWGTTRSTLLGYWSSITITLRISYHVTITWPLLLLLFLWVSTSSSSFTTTSASISGSAQQCTNGGGGEFFSPASLSLSFSVRGVPVSCLVLETEPLHYLLCKSIPFNSESRRWWWGRGERQRKEQSQYIRKVAKPQSGI